MELNVFTPESLPTFKIGDGIIFTTPEGSQAMPKDLEAGLKEKEFDNEFEKGEWIVGQIKKHCFTGILVGRNDDHLTVNKVRGPGGELLESTQYRVKFSEIIGVVQEGCDDQK